ncbi:MAG TPA: tRNA (guanosine(46)-N7)-methyltransferase TrmB [Opitutaceae bacterium]|nr:tRNA (guanosine(46)-N7)-methyltransferase TrmB [Opitutaceae bacterium]
MSIIEQRRSALRADLERVLPEHARFVWEVGCGHGHFLTAYASANPDRVCVGIDLIGERIERANKKRDRAKLGNLHFIQAEARLFLEALPAAARATGIFVLFPDPWPKLRHNKHRIIQPEFLSAAAERAELGCPLYFRTDFTAYFESARDVIATHPDWRIVLEPWPFEFVTVFQQRAPSFHSLVARRCPRPGEY